MIEEVKQVAEELLFSCEYATAGGNRKQFLDDSISRIGIVCKVCIDILEGLPEVKNLFYNDLLEIRHNIRLPGFLLAIPNLFATLKGACNMLIDLIRNNHMECYHGLH